MNPQRVRKNLTTLLAAAMLATTLVAVVGQAGAVAPADKGPKRGAAAIEKLGDRLPAVARANGLGARQLEDLFLDDDTLAVDANNELLYIDHAAPGEAVASTSTSASSATAAAPPVTDPVFFLHSRPGADHTIFLDFDGHTATGTSWNDATNPSIVTSPYNTDGNPDAWSASELNVIRQTWEIVAEDFSPWDVNVTTQDPGPDSLRRSGSGDTQWGVRVVITPDDWNNCGCGGFAYIGAFDDSTDEPAYVFNSSLLGVSEASTHEVGHTLSLAHDGLTTGASYYTGHGSGEASWAPLMGASYYENVTQWSAGEYYNANNNGSSANYGQGPDDLAVIASLSNGNGFGYRSDDHGDSIGSATAVAGPTLDAAGVVETTTDVDVFAFDTGSGAVSITLDPAPNRPNLNVRAELRTSSGALVAVADPTGGLGAGFNLTLGAGTYYVLVSGTGTGSPMSNSPSGYTGYASLGQYSLSGTVQPDGPADTTPPAPPTNVAATGFADSVVVSWTAGAESDLATHTVYRSGGSGGPYSAIATVDAATAVYTDFSVAPGSTYFYVVTSTDISGNESGNSVQVSATTPAPDTTPPPPPAGLSANATSDAIVLSWAAVADPDLASYRVYRSTTSGAGYALISSLGPTTTEHTDATALNNTLYHYVVTAIDDSGNQSAFSAEASAQRASPDMVAADVVTTYGTVSGMYVATTAAGGAGQSFTEAPSGGKPKNRHDRLEHIWSLPVTGGNHVLHVNATAFAAGDADAGTFDVAWGNSASGPWTNVITVSPGDGEQVADLGAVSGTIYLRLTDRNRTSGNNSNDTIVVDHIYLDGGAPPTSVPGIAESPTPGDDSSGVAVAPELSWTPGSEAMTSEVFFAPPGAELSSIGTTMGSSFDPGPLAPNTTYYWRVDSTNALGTTPGPLWSFETGDAPAAPTELRVDSVTLSTVSASKGNRRARATVVVVDDLGSPVTSVVVTGRFTGDITHEGSATTTSNGAATITSSSSAKKPSFDFCVVSATNGDLELAPGSPYLC